LGGSSWRYERWIKNPSNIEESQQTRIDYVLTNIADDMIEEVEILEFNPVISKDHKDLDIKQKCCQMLR